MSAAHFHRIAFLASDAPDADRALKRLSKTYGNAPFESADVVVALGGDGLMLQAMHRFMMAKLPIYGMNRGSVGFLMNNYNEKDLPQRLAAAELTKIHPLRMRVETAGGARQTALAFNEVSLLASAVTGGKTCHRH